MPSEENRCFVRFLIGTKFRATVADTIIPESVDPMNANAAPMPEKSRKFGQVAKAWMGAARATIQALGRGAKMAPGSLREPTSAAANDPFFLTSLHERYGPVLKARISGKITTCIFGIAQGRRFLNENHDSIEGATTNFRPLFPIGSLRQMTGEDHREYRRVFVEAIKGVRLSDHAGTVRDILDSTFKSLADREQPVDRETIRSALKSALTEVLFVLVLGIDRNWHGHDKLLAAYERYAPNGTVNTVRQDHGEIYAEMKSLLLLRADEIGTGAGRKSLLGQIIDAGTLDDTSIGNLLQMTEAGRYDMMGLWFWIVRMLGGQDELLDRIAALPFGEERTALCEAVPKETLRLVQSEYVLRRATEDIVFEGYFIPRRTMIRIAVWEAHKDPNTFEDPFAFKPMRFVGTKVTNDQYSPLGIGKHHCLGADWVIGLSAMLVDVAADAYRWRLLGDAAPKRGRFHFEPSESLSVEFRRL